MEATVAKFAIAQLVLCISYIMSQCLLRLSGILFEVSSRVENYFHLLHLLPEERKLKINLFFIRLGAKKLIFIMCPNRIRMIYARILFEDYRVPGG